eukprot:SM000044S15983  [mRNA]  locus=s44:346557:354690:- [translate_table: standard]
MAHNMVQGLMGESGFATRRSRAQAIRREGLPPLRGQRRCTAERGLGDAGGGSSWPLDKRQERRGGRKEGEAGEGSFPPASMWFLCYFVHRHLDFRVPELEALARLAGALPPLCHRLPDGDHPDSPFCFVDLPSEAAAVAIAARSMLIKAFFEVWGEASDYEGLEVAIAAYPEDRKALYLGADSSFKYVVDCFGRILSMQEQQDRIDRVSYVPFQGRVQLRNPDHKFWIIESQDSGTNRGLPPLASQRVIFAREVACSDRPNLITKYALPSRNFLGPTAMDAEVAFIMANQALARQGSLVYDPFAGTGSILVAAAHHGAMTVGADIDIRILRDGKGPDRNVWANFEQYGLPLPLTLLRADNNSPPWRPDLREVFDAIICDPPYGVRAGGRKSGGRKLLAGCSPDEYMIPEDKRDSHIPSTAPYTMAECLHDLLDVAARLLIMGGRLVFFYPAARQSYRDDELPTHPCFTLVANCEQVLTQRWSRRLLTMEKCAPYSLEVELTAAARHLDFRVNHVALLAEARKADLHDLVFAPANSAAYLHRQASMAGCSEETGSDGFASERRRHNLAHGHAGGPRLGVGTQEVRRPRVLLARGMFRRANPRAGEALLHFLLTAPAAAAAAAAPQQPGTAACKPDALRNMWPILDPRQAREFRKVAHARIMELEAAGALPRSSSRLSSLAACGGPRFVELLWQLSDFVLHEEYSKRCRNVTNGLQSFSAATPADVAPSTLLAVTKARITLERKAFLTRALHRSQLEVSWQAFAKSVTAENRQLQAEQAHIVAELGDAQLAVEESIQQAAGGTGCKWDALLAHLYRVQNVATKELQEAISSRENSCRLDGPLLANRSIPRSAQTLGQKPSGGGIDIAAILQTLARAVWQFVPSLEQLTRTQSASEVTLLSSVASTGAKDSDRSHIVTMQAAIGEQQRRCRDLQVLFSKLLDTLLPDETTIAELKQRVELADGDTQHAHAALSAWGKAAAATSQASSSGTPTSRQLLGLLEERAEMQQAANSLALVPPTPAARLPGSRLVQQGGGGEPLRLSPVQENASHASAAGAWASPLPEHGAPLDDLIELRQNIMLTAQRRLQEERDLHLWHSRQAAPLQDALRTPRTEVLRMPERASRGWRPRLSSAGSFDPQQLPSDSPWKPGPDCSTNQHSCTAAHLTAAKMDNHDKACKKTPHLEVSPKLHRFRLSEAELDSPFFEAYSNGNEASGDFDLLGACTFLLIASQKSALIAGLAHVRRRCSPPLDPFNYASSEATEAGHLVAPAMYTRAYALRERIRRPHCSLPWPQDMTARFQERVFTVVGLIGPQKSDWRLKTACMHASRRVEVALHSQRHSSGLSKEPAGRIGEKGSWIWKLEQCSE